MCAPWCSAKSEMKWNEIKQPPVCISFCFPTERLPDPVWANVIMWNVFCLTLSESEWGPEGAGRPWRAFDWLMVAGTALNYWKALTCPFPHSRQPPSPPFRPPVESPHSVLPPPLPPTPPGCSVLLFKLRHLEVQSFMGLPRRGEKK